MERPDLTGVSPDVIAYIQKLEAALQGTPRTGGRGASDASAPAEPSEPPTTMQVISVSRAGLAKRTPRHLYLRQRRGGMGVFDLDCDEGDRPRFLLQADLDAALILVTDRARAFRIPVSQLAETDVRGRGAALADHAVLQPDETVALLFADSGGSQLVLVTERGQVRRISGHYFGNTLRAGTILYDVKEGGAPAAACWTSGGGDLFIGTRAGKAIRFSERQVPLRGCLGIRLDPADSVIGVAATTEEDGIFLLTDEGKGTIRLMRGFTANKSPGSGGKVAIKSDAVIGLAPINMATLARHDLFVISELGKIIRFAAEEVPPKEGVVQGVNCMNLRADACVGLMGVLVADSAAG